MSLGVCAQCGATEQAEPTCSTCHKSTQLDARYRLIEAVGHGAMGTTYRAQHLESGEEVAVKEMIIRAADVLKQRELFDRESNVLQSLDHPGVPRYIDHLDSRGGKVWNLYLVQAFVDGQSLEAERKGRRYTEAEVCATLAELADILIYLHRLRPPVVHRDLKPANVMRTTEGRLVLIDFGSVKGALDPDLGGSTVAGTFGYMPPEQLVGRASPSSDLYALGMIGAVLLTGRDAVDLAQHDGVRWRPHTTASEPLANLIDELLTRDAKHRPDDAAAVAVRLRAIAETGQDPESKTLAVPGGIDLRVKLPSAPRSAGLRGLTPSTTFNLLFGTVFGGVGGTVGLAFMLFGFLGSSPLSFGFTGLAVTAGFGGFGGVMVVGAVRKILRRRRLFRLGRAVDAVVESTSPNLNVEINGRNPLVIRFRYRLDGIDYTAHEDRLDSTLPSNLVGASVTALIDPDEPDHASLYFK